MRGNKILERLTVQDSNTPHSCDYRYNTIIKIRIWLGFNYFPISSKPYTIAFFAFNQTTPVPLMVSGKNCIGYQNLLHTPYTDIVVALFGFHPCLV